MRLLFLGTVFVLSLIAQPARSAFHVANIDEVMTSYADDPAVQFVEIIMNLPGQNIVSSSKLSAFDAAGSFLGVVLTVSGNVQSGAQRRWIMGTAAFESVSGLNVDFQFAPGLPTGGGMVCWGKPFDETAPNSYVDCVAYGDYAGPTNFFIGNPTPLSPDGHSLRRVSDTNDSLNDFECGDPADPENNSRQTSTMAATTPCGPCGNDLLDAEEECDGSDEALCPGLCLSDCMCPEPVCGNNLRELSLPGEECDGTDDFDCPGSCLQSCICGGLKRVTCDCLDGTTQEALPCDASCFSAPWSQECPFACAEHGGSNSNGFNCFFEPVGSCDLGLCGQYKPGSRGAV